MDVQFRWNPSGEPQESPQPTQTNNYTQTGGGYYNPQIQGVNIADGGGNINMGSVIGGGGIDQLGKERMGPLGVVLGKIHGISGGLSTVILCLFGSLCAYLFLPEGMV